MYPIAYFRIVAVQQNGGAVMAGRKQVGTEAGGAMRRPTGPDEAGAEAVVAAAVAAALPVPVPLAAPAAPVVAEAAAQELAPAASFPAAADIVPTNVSKKEKVMPTAEELVSFQQGNFEAMIKSGQIWAAGVQDLSRLVAASVQAQIDETVGTVKALSGVKSVREAVELHTSLARSSVEKVVAEGGKLTDASFKLAEQTWAPITARFTLAAERFSHAA